MRGEISRLLRVIKRGMIVVMPLVLIGSFVTVFQELPVPVYQKIINSFCNGAFVKMTNYVIFVTLDCISLFTAAAIGYSYAKEYKEEIPHPSIAMIVCTMAFLTVSYSWKKHMLDVMLFDMRGIIATVIISLCAMTLFRKVYGIKVLRLEKSVYGINTALKDSYGYIIPCTILIATFAFINVVVENLVNAGTLYEIMVTIPVRIFEKAGCNVFTAIVYMIFVAVLSLIGLRGQSALRYVCVCIFAGGAGTTLAAKELGISEILNETFFNSFVFMGGSGAIISLAICIMIYSKSESIIRLNNISFVASLINVNDMMVFGVPIVENAVMAVPFVIIPFINLFVTIVAIKLGIIPPVVNEVIWIMPPVINGYMATGSISAGVLQIILIAAGVFIYKPFLLKHEEKLDENLKNGVVKLQEELQKYEKIGKQSDFLVRQDEVGEMARILGRDMGYALEHGELELKYQPQVNVNGECIGTEALLRWNHKVVGYIYPPLIIAIAKETGKLFQLEQFIFDRACRDLKYIHENILPGSKVSVNITGASLYAKNLENVIEEAVDKYDIDGSRLWIEITEQDAIAMTPEINARLLRLQNKGHKLLIDDFGMGHTSIMYLQNNSFDVVKLDGSITTDVLKNSRSCQIISSIAYLAETMGFHIIAEYVETDEQRDKLAELRCDAFQGYLYSKPLSVEELQEWVEKRRKISSNKIVVQ